jgi:plastocyanin
METYGVIEDANGNPILDANGRFMPNSNPPTVFVQRKEKGFGVDYGVIRNGAWEYVAYRPDGSGAVPSAVLQHYVFVPTTIHAQPGQVVTVYNYDQILHHIVADDNSFDAGVMKPVASFSVTAGATGTTISYHCTLHSRMKGKIVVDAPQQ